MAFDQTNVAGDTLVYASIHSPNYAQGSSGWTINKDGSAEFQNVLVRGTITASTIIGSTIIGGTITAGVLVSSNWTQNTTGWVLNGTAAPYTGTGGTVAANTIEIDSNFFVRGTGAATPNIQASVNSTSPAWGFNSGLAGETVPSYVYAAPGTGTRAVQTGTGIQGSTNSNGVAGLQVFSSPSASSLPALVQIFTSGETLPTGHTIKGQTFLGGIAAADTWSLGVQNTNKANTFGTGTGNESGLTIGDQFTPGQRLTISSQEIVTYNAALGSDTLYLNDSTDSSFFGPVVNRTMRNQYVRDTAGHAGLNSTTFVVVGTTAIVTLVLPASGVIQVWHKTRLTQDATAIGTYQADVICKNVTQSTTPYGGSANNSFNYQNTVAVPATLNFDISGFISLGGSAGAQGGILGNTGDTITVQVAYAVTAGSWTVGDIAISVTPSL
jgi:hypothetical protein